MAGDLAESWEASADALTWMFNLRKGVEFRNGKTLDAEDVVHSINLHRGEDSTSGASGVVAGITDVKADGKDKVVFSLKEGSADFPYLISDYHLVIGVAGTEGPEWDKGIGTGPFVLTEWNPGVRSASKRNPNYFKEGRPYVDEVETLNIGDTEARVNALRTGETDAIEEPDLKTAHLLAQAEGIRVVEANGFKHFTFPMHTDRAPFDNNGVRLALKHAIDREAVLDTVLRGYGYVGNDHPIGRNQFNFARDLEQRQYEPHKAKFHLKKAGVENLKVTPDATDIYAGGTDSALLFKEHAAGAGIDIEIERVSVDGFWSNTWMKKDFITSFWGGRPTADWMFSVAYAQGAAWHDTFWSHERFNQLLLAARGPSSTWRSGGRCTPKCRASAATKAARSSGASATGCWASATRSQPPMRSPATCPWTATGLPNAGGSLERRRRGGAAPGTGAGAGGLASARRTTLGDGQGHFTLRLDLDSGARDDSRTAGGFPRIKGKTSFP